MKKTTKTGLETLIATYEQVMEVMEHDAAKAIEEDARAYGGFIRAGKGKMQEFITDRLIRLTWATEMGMPDERLHINSNKIQIPILPKYIESLESKPLQDFIRKNIADYKYGLSVDKHVFIDRKFVIGIECKAYTENAMIKRILVDFHLLRTRHPNLRCFLFQLESQLGGDYHSTARGAKGSRPTHTIMSYFENVDLRVVTLLDGERKVDRPINKKEFFKPLKLERLEAAVEELIEGFGKCGHA